MKNHIPTFETCMKLKDSGFSQDSLLFWVVESGNSSERLAIYESGNNEFVELFFYDDPDKFVLHRRDAIYSPFCAAPTLTEIIPKLEKLEYGFFISVIENEYKIHFGNCGFNTSDWSENAAEAAALLWLEKKAILDARK